MKKLLIIAGLSLIASVAEAAYIVKENVKLNSNRYHRVIPGDSVSLMFNRSLYTDRVSFEAKCGDVRHKKYVMFELLDVHGRPFASMEIRGRSPRKFFKEFKLQNKSFVKGLRVTTYLDINGQTITSARCKIRQISAERFYGPSYPHIPHADSPEIMSSLELLSHNILILRDLVTVQDWENLNKMRSLVDDATNLSRANAGLTQVLAATKKVVDFYITIEDQLQRLRSNEFARQIVNDLITTLEYLDDQVQ